MDIREFLKIERFFGGFHKYTFAIVLSPIIIFALTVISQYSSNPTDPSVIKPLPQNPVTVFPDFTKIVNVDDKKRQFLDYMQSFLDAENQEIMILRSRLLEIRENVEEGTPSIKETAEVANLSETYRIDHEGMTIAAMIDELLLRVDLIPVSMALAQAANESAWGTSRFTIEGNNVFGQWCYEEGCGIVPSRRISGATHEVRYFDTVEKSVESYFLNINTHDSYAYLRDLRLKMRARGLKLDPMSLSIGLGRYSQRGAGYVDEIQRIIIQNDLRERDVPPNQA